MRTEVSAERSQDMPVDGQIAVSATEPEVRRKRSIVADTQGDPAQRLVACGRLRRSSQRRTGSSTATVPAIPSIGSDLVTDLDSLDMAGLRLRWRNHLGSSAPAHLPRWLLIRILAYRLQAQLHGDLPASTRRRLLHGDNPLAGKGSGAPFRPAFAARLATTRNGTVLASGSLLVREWNGVIHRVMIGEDGAFLWNDKSWSSLSRIAHAITGTSWNGHRFFGLGKGERQ